MLEPGGLRARTVPSVGGVGGPGSVLGAGAGGGSGGPGVRGARLVVMRHVSSSCRLCVCVGGGGDELEVGSQRLLGSVLLG